MTVKKITSKVLQMAFYYTNYKNYEFVAPNVYLKWDCELDIFALRKSGYVDEIEIKISKSDYLADFSKQVVVKCERIEDGMLRKSERVLKHDALQQGKLSTNRFSFLMPEELADKCDIPEYAGLYVYTARGRVRQIKRAPLLHKEKISDSLKYKTAKKMTYRYWQTLK